MLAGRCGRGERESWLWWSFWLDYRLCGGLKIKQAISHSCQKQKSRPSKESEEGEILSFLLGQLLFDVLSPAYDSRTSGAFKSAQGDRNKSMQETFSFTDKHVYPSAENRLEPSETKWTTNTHWMRASRDKNCSQSRITCAE